MLGGILNRYTIAYDRTDGREIWRTKAPAKQIEAFHKSEGSPAASTPATDGKQIVSYFGSCGLFYYDLAGKELWKVEMPTAELIGDFGSGVSPIIAEDIVVLVRDQKKDSRIYAFDLATGAIRWEHNRKSPLSYCTPIVWKTSDDQQIVAAGHARIVGYDLKTGTEKWSAGNVPSGCCSSPVIAGNILFFAGGSAGELDIEPQMPSFDSMLGDLDKDKDGALSRDEAEKAFEGFFDNQDANRDGRITRDEWEFISRLYSEGKNSAFALRLGGSGDAGHLVVVSSAKLGERTAATPAIADNTLFIRTEQHLYAFGERK